MPGKMPDALVCVLNTDRFDINEEGRFLPFLNSERLKEYLSVTNIQAKTECLCSYLLLKYMVKVRDQPFDLIKTDTGKPILRNSDIHVSISHSKGLVSAAVSAYNIAIDMEKIRCINLKSAHRGFTHSEIMAIKSDIDFLKLWTRKECIVKYFGKGVVSSANAFDEKLCKFLNTFQEKDYIISVCSQSNVVLQEVDYDDFEKFFLNAK